MTIQDERPKGSRCSTWQYVTTNKDDVERLAKIDGTPENEIHCENGVEPLCVQSFWNYWSDGRFTTKTFASRGERPSGDKCPVTEHAREFISSAAGSDSGLPKQEILDMLVKSTGVREVKEHHVTGGGGYYARPRVIEYDVDMPGGKTEKLFVSTVGYFEGYMFEVERTLKDAKKNFN